GPGHVLVASVVPRDECALVGVEPSDVMPCRADAVVVGEVVGLAVGNVVAVVALAVAIEDSAADSVRGGSAFEPPVPGVLQVVDDAVVAHDSGSPFSSRSRDRAARYGDTYRGRQSGVQ